MPRIRYIHGNCTGPMPCIHDKQSHCARTIATYTFMQNARCFTALFSNTLTFPAVASSSPVYLLPLQYIKLELNIITIAVTRKGGGVRRSEARYITVVIIPSIYYMKNDLVASKRKVKK